MWIWFIVTSELFPRRQPRTLIHASQINMFSLDSLWNFRVCPSTCLCAIHHTCFRRNYFARGRTKLELNYLISSKGNIFKRKKYRKKIFKLQIKTLDKSQVLSNRGIWHRFKCYKCIVKWNRRYLFNFSLYQRGDDDTSLDQAI